MAVSFSRGGGIQLASAASCPPRRWRRPAPIAAAIVAALAAEPGHAGAVPVAGDRLSGGAHPPSWADCSLMPARCCRCCGGWRWWCELVDPSGWQCITCHPPPALPGYQAPVVAVQA